MLKRPLLLALFGATLVVALALAGGYAYFFSGLRSTPKALALASPSSAPSATPSPVGGSVAWTVAPGSVARYRVNEVFAGTTSNHEAVAETKDLSGGLTIRGDGATTDLIDLKIVARLTSLHSIDTVAGLNVGQRDRIVQQTLSTGQFPEATFVAQKVSLPSGAGGATTQPFSVTGDLTIHGVTRTEQVTVKQLQVAGSTAQVVGQTTFKMTDFNIQPPALPITAVQPQVTLEFELDLGRA